MSLPHPLRFDEIVEWDNDRVCQWLRDIGIPEAQQHFRLERIDGMKLIQLGMDVSGIVHKIKELKKKKKLQELLTKYLKLFEKEVQDRALGKVPVGGSFKKAAGRGTATSAPSRVPPPLPQPEVVDDVEEFDDNDFDEEWEEDEDVYENTPSALNGVPPLSPRNGELDRPPSNSAPPLPPPSRSVNGHLKPASVTAVESDDEDDYVEPNKQENPPTVPAWKVATLSRAGNALKRDSVNDRVFEPPATPPPAVRAPPPPPLQPSEEFYEAPNEEALPPPPFQLPTRSVPRPPISPQQPVNRAPAAPPSKLSSSDELPPNLPAPPPPTGRGFPQKLPPGRAGQAVPPVPGAGRVPVPQQQNGRVSGAASPRALPSPAVIDEPGDELYEATDTYEQNQQTHLSSNSVENDEEFYENPDDALPVNSPRGPAMAGRSLPPTPPLPSGKITPQSAPAVPFGGRGRQAAPPPANAPPQVRGRHAEPPPPPEEEFYVAPDDCAYKAPSPPPSRGRPPAPLPPPQVAGRQLPTPAVKSPPPQEVDEETYEATDEYVDRPLTSPLGQGGSSRPSSFDEETYEATEEYIAKPMTPAPPLPSSNRQSAARQAFGSSPQTRGPPAKPPPLPDTDRARLPVPAPPHEEEEGDTYEAMEKAPSLPPPRPGAARDVGPGNAKSREPAARQNYDTPPPPVTSPRQRAAIPTPNTSGQDMDVAKIGGVAMPGLRIGDGTLKKAKDRLVPKAAAAAAPSPGSSVSAAAPPSAPVVAVPRVSKGRVSVPSRPPSDPPGNEGWVPPGAPPSQRADSDRPAPGAPICQNDGSKEDDRLDQYPWYFGKIDRVEATELVTRLNKEGAYLVRKSEKGGDEFPFTLCVVHNREVFNIQLRKTVEDKFALGKKKPKEHIHSTVEDLIRFHQNNEIEVSKASGPCGGVRLTHCPRK